MLAEKRPNPWLLLFVFIGLAAAWTVIGFFILAVNKKPENVPPLDAASLLPPNAKCEQTSYIEDEGLLQYKCKSDGKTLFVTVVVRPTLVEPKL